MPTSNTVTDDNSNSYTVYYSTNSGEANLTVGFYIYGSGDLIKYKKRWDFGDGDVEINRDIVANHFYGPTTKSSFNVLVTILDDNENPITEPMVCPINLSQHKNVPPVIANFYQTEGVIFAGSYVGFSVVTSTEDTTWHWGDSQP